MINVQKALDYIQGVLSGEIVANKYIKLACQKHLDDLQKSETDPDYPYYFDAAKAEKVAKFIQLLPHTKGKWASKGEKITLEPWQIFACCLPFGWLKRATGYRRYTKLLIFVCRKNGKSAIAAGVGNYMFCADGEFGAEVYSGATTEKQAWEVFRPAKIMVERTLQLKDYFGIEVNASNMARPADGSRFEPIIGKPGDGSSPSCAIIDEYHEHKNNDLYDTMETGMGAREQPIMLVITTAGSSIGGACHQMVRDAERMLDGAIDIPDLWAVLYGMDKDDDWTSDIALKKANPNMDISVSAEFLQARQRDAKMSAAKQAIFRTKHLNEWVGAKNAWLNMAKWAMAPERLPLSALTGRPCFIGLDLATKIDMVALVLLFPPYGDDKRYHVHGRYYLPDSRVIEELDSNTDRYRAWDKEGLLSLTMGEVIDFDAIKDDLREFYGRFDVREVAYDPWQATQLAQEMEKEGMVMVELRHTVQNLSEPMKELEALILQQRIAHGDCPILSWQASNVVAKIDAKDNIYPNKERSENKIDGIVALIMAMGRANVHQHMGNIDDFLDNIIIG
ncbi:Phage terminase-like protein, large subunit, contains N-terminal HTH domain [Moraxella cuniculi DSM 21768]|uniref:Phage terminase-like protein, large subunit, contains N-terminal HTH domain n=1 Tax=Moraxella cuniculi DSM 21768 TaxID=1122245 RepID=A0A1N7G4P7_9GAMM|nr:terminase TerL endonuclease subunit [Moraxella cuniculi]OOS03259.1 terminase [Moraxella cuniculi]SIS07542.1 Phage terminase-like protein, large subunit, contains N-terminal HTH domain [Moraxella cuniculi DSM 21768]